MTSQLHLSPLRSLIFEIGVVAIVQTRSTDLSTVFHQHPYYLLLPYAIKTTGPVEGSLEGFIERSPQIKSALISLRIVEKKKIQLSAGTLSDKISDYYSGEQPTPKKPFMILRFESPKAIFDPNTSSSTHANTSCFSLMFLASRKKIARKKKGNLGYPVGETVYLGFAQHHLGNASLCLTMLSSPFTILIDIGIRGANFQDEDHPCCRHKRKEMPLSGHCCVAHGDELSRGILQYSVQLFHIQQKCGDAMVETSLLSA
ncbi:hypothetical protein L2E82_15213 [Cichorium intybus]|uniref:Uncharacterized protein n=1 Tax=Cichorium intybus TaxID=13427 RepID=A0ACB9F2I9_CICIN|nr:hypothetical protein L2E82_15213 [Cichorium intybus]